MRTVLTPELVAAVNKVFNKADSGGCAPLLLESELTISIMRDGKHDLDLTLPAQLTVYFHHGKPGSNGQVSDVRLSDRSPSWFTINSKDNSIVLSVKGFAPDGALRVVRTVNTPSVTPRLRAVPMLSNLTTMSA